MNNIINNQCWEGWANKTWLIICDPFTMLLSKQREKGDFFQTAVMLEISAV